MQHQSLSSISHDMQNSAQYRHQPDCGSRCRELALKIERFKGQRRDRESSNLYSASQPCEGVMLYIYKAVWKKAEVGWLFQFACLVTSASPSTKRGRPQHSPLPSECKRKNRGSRKNPIFDHLKLAKNDRRISKINQ